MREVERFVGFGGGYINPRHYFLLSGVAKRPDCLKDEKPLRATYVDLFSQHDQSATVADHVEARGLAPQ